MNNDPINHTDRSGLDGEEYSAFYDEEGGDYAAEQSADQGGGSGGGGNGLGDLLGYDDQTGIPLVMHP